MAISRSATAERILMLEQKEQQLRLEMDKLCSRYGLLTQELLIIIESIKLELKDELEELGVKTRNFPKLDRYLVD